MTAQDVAAAVGRIGPPYKAYEQSFVDNGIDGRMVARVTRMAEADASNFLVTLGIPSPLHISRVLMEFETWTQP